MKRIRILLFVLTIVSCNQQKVDTKAEGEKVMQLSKEWSEVASTGDVEKTVSYWADNAIVMSAGEPTRTGISAMRQMVEESFKMSGFRISWEPQGVEVSENGDMAYLIEKSQVTFTDSTGKPVTLINRVVTIWSKQPDGTWKNTVEISTPD